MRSPTAPLLRAESRRNNATHSHQPAAITAAFENTPLSMFAKYAKLPANNKILMSA